MPRPPTSTFRFPFRCTGYREEATFPGDGDEFGVGLWRSVPVQADPGVRIEERLTQASIDRSDIFMKQVDRGSPNSSGLFTSVH